jgi:hypothetical protein
MKISYYVFEGYQVEYQAIADGRDHALVNCRMLLLVWRSDMENQGRYFRLECQLLAWVRVFGALPSEAMKEIAIRRYTWKIVKQQYLPLFS